MMWDNYGMGYGWWIVGAGVMILVVGLIVAAVWFAARQRTPALGGNYSPAAVATPVGVSQSAARSILDERYARGELTSDEYRERLSNLGM